VSLAQAPGVDLQWNMPTSRVAQQQSKWTDLLAFPCNSAQAVKTPTLH
jgi:hypothetical protein